MRKLGLVLVVALAASGCYARVGGGLHVRANPLAVVATAITVAAVAHAVATAPPVAVNVEYYDYGHRPGHVWVNGRYAYVNNAWVWHAGYWQPERAGNYWVQGYWAPQGNQHVWVDGYWAAPRQGYVYVDGYWDWHGNGYVWRHGTWEVDRPGHVYVGGTWTTYNGRRTWQRGGWQHDDGRADWTRYRARGRVNAGGGVRVRDHRR
jgi:hypothetical protein